MKTNIVLAILLIGKAQLGFGQGFINFNFESTTLAANGSPGTVSTAIGLPSWTASIGGVTQSTILYNNGTLGASSIALLSGANSPNPTIDGNFSVQLVGGASGDAMISQNGVVPANANSIFFESYSQNSPNNNLAVSLNGQIINILLFSASVGYNTYFGDVSSFAGQTANLTFTAPASTPSVKIFVLDDISFSPTAVPEPSTPALCALGGLFFAWRKRRIFSRA